jgi:hypothetical protein
LEESRPGHSAKNERLFVPGSIKGLTWPELATWAA